jgi:hypothetical protein
MTTDEEVRPDAEERMAEIPDPPAAAAEDFREWRRRITIAILVAGVAMATAMVVAAFALGGQSEAQERATANASAAAQANQKAGVADNNASAALAAAREANRRLVAAGKPTVPIPTITITPPIQPVPEGLSGAQLAAVQVLIANQLAAYQPQISPATVRQIAAQAAALVPKAADGKTPTVAELQPIVFAAQAAYCSSGVCAGKEGVKGADAPAVTDEQLRPLIASALAAYCGQETKPCDGKAGADSTIPGPSGPAGPSGPRGAAAPYIADTDCIGNDVDSYWRLYFSDGTTKTSKGPCRIGFDPEPGEPTVTPGARKK